MKNKILTVFMLITTTLALTACTQADSDNSTADNSSTTLQSGSVAAENLAGGAMISGDGPITGISDIDNKTSAVIEAQPEIQHGSGFGGVGITEAIQNEENYADDEPDAVDEDEMKRVLRRLNAAATANSITALAHYLRGLVQLLRTEGIPLDYAALAGDIFRYQFPETAAQVRLAWGQDFYKCYNKNKLGEDKES